jgi:hypothetical protein
MWRSKTNGTGPAALAKYPTSSTSPLLSPASNPLLSFSRKIYQNLFFLFSPHIRRRRKGGVEVIMHSVFLSLIVACVAGLTQGFVPTSWGSVAEVQRQNYRLQALSVRMQGEGRTDRRSILLRGALPAKSQIFDLASVICYRLKI